LQYTFEGGFPSAGTAERAYDEADLRRALEAYKFFYPVVANEAVMKQGLAAGAGLRRQSLIPPALRRFVLAGRKAMTALLS